MFYDSYGHPENSTDYRRKEAEVYKLDEATSGVKYICYDDNARTVIRRITTSANVTTVEVAFGAWADRVTLVYQPVNKPIEVA